MSGLNSLAEKLGIHIGPEKPQSAAAETPTVKPTLNREELDFAGNDHMVSTVTGTKVDTEMEGLDHSVRFKTQSGVSGHVEPAPQTQPKPKPVTKTGAMLGMYYDPTQSKK